VIGGTLAATVIAIFFIPMFFWLLETFSERVFGGRAPEKAATADGATPAPAKPQEGE